MKETGGPAFPQPIAVGPAGDVYHSEISGVTVRDYIAIKAMQAMSTPEFLHQLAAAVKQGDPFASRTSVREELARLAYLQADAMIQERAIL